MTWIQKHSFEIWLVGLGIGLAIVIIGVSDVLQRVLVYVGWLRG